VLRRLSLRLFVGSLSVIAFSGACGDRAEKTPPPAAAPVPPTPPPPAPVAPEKFRAEFETTKGKFVIEVTRSLSPLGADRFYTLVDSGYFTDVRFFRVVSGFVVQFGMHGDPAMNSRWQARSLLDEPVRASNTRGTIVYAKAGPNTRSNQFFINLGDNSGSLDPQGFSPFGTVVEGMDVVGKLYSGYGDETVNRQGEIAAGGNDFLKQTYPKLDYIKSAKIVQ
jgi:peptidyl-prolyl cis-trans isomerase A (cyclophilin A)